MHVLPYPFIFLRKRDIIETDFLQAKLYSSLFGFSRGWSRKIIKDELVIPCGVGAVHASDGIVHAHVIQFYIILEEEPVGDANSDLTGVEKSILVTVFHQYAL